MQKFLEKHHIYYGWVMVVAGILVMSVTHGVVQNCFSQFIKPVSESLNVSRSSFAINMTILNVVYMVVALFSGKIFVKLKLRNLMRIASVALPIIYFSYSFCREMWMFYALSVAAGLMMSCLTFLAFTMIISQWFIEKRGTAIGVCFMGSGLGGMLFQNLSNSWIKTVGWAGTYRILAVIMAAVMIPLVYFVIRQRPQDMGLQPYGSQIEEAGGEEPVYGPTLGGAMKSFSFWALIVLAISVGLSTTMLSQTIVPHLGDIGFTTEWASTVAAIYLGLLAICKAMLGGMYDKLGMKKSTFLAVLAITVGLAGLYFGKHPAAHMMVIVGAALGCASGTVSYPILAQSAFGTRDYATIYGIVSAASSLASSISPLFFNRVYDATGSYNGALLTGIALTVLAQVMLQCVRPAKKEAA